MCIIWVNFENLSLVLNFYGINDEGFDIAEDKNKYSRMLLKHLQMFLGSFAHCNIHCYVIHIARYFCNVMVTNLI